MLNALTIDVEDWFHILDLEDGCTMADFAAMESRVEKNTTKLLRILREFNVKGTFFVLGWVAENFPDLIREIHREGHEIASHGYSHTLCYEMSTEDFRQDTLKSICILEELTGERILGYRVPGFSIGSENLDVLDILLDLGFKYDSSIYPGTRGHGGFPGAPRYIYQQSTPKGKRILEMPSSCFNIFGKNVAFAGGGYLRLFPYSVIKRGIYHYNKDGHPVNVYLHPREIDPNHPRLEMPLHRKFKSYVNLRSTETKLKALLRDYRFGRAKDVLGIK